MIITCYLKITGKLYLCNYSLTLIENKFVMHNYKRGKSKKRPIIRMKLIKLKIEGKN